ncbi:MAG: type II/IV secretion system ATPase subunit, partial [Candidatus Caldarchaeum sp.]
MSNVPSRVLMENPHLRMYIEELRLQGKTATYVEQLSREMRNLRSYSFIYPVGDPLFIHVESRPSERSSYNVISPFTMAPVEINKIVEKGLARLITPEMDYTTREEHEKLLNELLDMFLEIDDTLEDFDYRPIYRKGIVEKLAANQTTADIIRNSVILDKVYLGTLEPFIRDQYIEDVSCNGVGPIFVEHKIFGSCETNITFSDQEELDTFVVKLSERIGRAVNFRKPIVDASLPDGSRINIVFGSDVSRHGSNFTIRKFSEKPVSIADLISWGTMSSLEAAYLWIMLEHGMSIWFCGETAS